MTDELKTLKDLTERVIIRPDYHFEDDNGKPIFVNDEKTLQALSDYKSTIRYSDLKQEAIKDINALLKSEPKIKEIPVFNPKIISFEYKHTIGKDTSPLREAEIDAISQVIAYIKWKFNLTEEEIKNG